MVSDIIFWDLENQAEVKKVPKKKITITYLCEICFSEHNGLEGALVCEQRGVFIPEFKRHEVVELVGLSADVQVRVSSGFEVRVQNGTKGIVHGEGLSHELSSPHQLPTYYEVWIQTSGGPYKREVAEFSRKNLKIITVKDGTFCPLCASGAKPAKEAHYTFLVLGKGFPLLKNVPMYKCSNCNAEFFTIEQSKKVELLIGKKIKWPVANTHRLLKEFQF